MASEKNQTQAQRVWPLLVLLFGLVGLSLVKPNGALAIASIISLFVLVALTYALLQMGQRNSSSPKALRLKVLETIVRSYSLERTIPHILRHFGKELRLRRAEYWDVTEIGHERLHLWDATNTFGPHQPGLRAEDLPSLLDLQHLDFLDGKALVLPIMYNAKQMGIFCFYGSKNLLTSLTTGDELDEIAAFFAVHLYRLQQNRFYQDSDRRLKAFLDQSPIFATIENAKGQALFLSKKAQEILQEQSAQSQLLTGSHRSDDAAAPLSGSEVQGDEKESAISQPRGGTPQRHWLTWNFPLSDASGEYLVGTLSLDMTEQKNREIARELAFEAAEAANNAKSDFLINLSHAIRTPMNGIQGMTELLLMTPMPMEQREYLKMVKSSAEALLLIVSDILDFSSLDAKSLRLDSSGFDLQDSIAHIIKPLGIRALERNLRFTCHIEGNVPSKLLGDPPRINQILINLLGNAIKFTKKGEIFLRVSVLSDSAASSRLRFAVSDTGIGIPSEKIVRIFEAFQQVDSSLTRGFGGSGLGLTIATRLARLMGGHIYVESNVGQGSLFCFDVDLLKASDQQYPFGVSTQKLEHHVLVCVSHAYSLQAVTEPLRLLRSHVKSLGRLGDARAELEAARLNGQAFDTLVIDEDVDGEAGFDLIRLLRSMPAYAGLRIILMIDDLSPALALLCQEFKVTGRLQKPFIPKDLWEQLERPFEVPPIPKRLLAPVPRRLVKVLLAEDNLINQTLVIKLLEKRSCKVTLAKNGKEAVEFYLESDHDLILMDIQMPLMSGTDATQRIRYLEKTSGRHIPIIAMTAHAMQGDREKYLASGMDEYISKPIRIDELFATIDRIFFLEEDLMKDSQNLNRPLIDEEKLRSDMDNDWDLIQEICRIFIASTPGLLADLRQAVTAKDASAIEHQAHKLKGSIAIFGAIDVTLSAQIIEDMGETGKIEGVEISFARLEVSTLALIEELKIFLSQKSAA